MPDPPRLKNKGGFPRLITEDRERETNIPEKGKEEGLLGDLTNLPSMLLET